MKNLPINTKKLFKSFLTALMYLSLHSPLMSQIGVSTGAETALLTDNNVNQDTHIGLRGSIHLNSIIVSFSGYLVESPLFRSELSYRHYDNDNRMGVYVSGHIGMFYVDNYGGGSFGGGIGYRFPSGIDLEFRHFLLLTPPPAPSTALLQVSSTLLSFSLSYTLFK